MWEGPRYGVILSPINTQLTQDFMATRTFYHIVFVTGLEEAIGFGVEKSVMSGETD